MGSTNKLTGARIVDQLSSRGKDLIEEMLNLADDGDNEMKFRVYKELMPYVYAKRREEDSEGKTADFVAVPVTAEETAEFIKAARGQASKP